MSWIKRLTSSFRSHRLESDLQREIDFHLDMRAREKTAAGASPEDARKQVIERFGNVARVKEDCRDQAAFAWVGAIRQDLRYACRNVIVKNPGFTSTTVACIAIAIGANAAIFSFVNAFLFQPIPRGVVMVQHASGSPVSFPDFQDWRRSNGVFDAVAAYSPGEALNIGRGTVGTRVLGEAVAGDYFQALGVVPAAGRLLASGDESQALAVVSYDYWRNSDSGIVGKTIWINRQAFTVTGVAPRGFYGMLAPWSTSVWVTPYGHREQLADRRAGAFMVFGRLKAGVSAMQAASAMNSLDGELAKMYPDPQANRRDVLTVARRGGLSGSPVWSVFLAMSVLLMVAVGIIFLIACGNVAGLLMARSLARRREITIRLSLGASRGRLVRQLLTESVLLALLGGGFGVVLAYAAGNSLADLMPQSITGGFPFRHGIDANVLWLALGLSAASAVVSGLLPAWRASDQNLAAAGKAQGVSGVSSSRLRKFLIVAQVAGAVLVLSTAGLFIRSFQKAQAVDLGSDTSHMVTADLDLRPMKFSRAQVAAFQREVRDRVAGMAGVASVSLADVVPFGDTRVLNVPGRGQIASATVDRDYFRTAGIRLVRGREPEKEERNVVLVNDALAKRFWPGEDPVGKLLARGNGKASLQVVGVVATGRYWSTDEPPRPFVYQIASDPDEVRASLVVRTQGPPGGMVAPVSQAIQSVDPDLPAMPVRTENDRIRRWLEPQRSAAVLLGFLGFSALGLAITALFALLAQMVVQRSAEIAVRVALGATRASIAGLLLRQSAVLVGAGAVVGLGLAGAVGGVLAHNFGPLEGMDGVAVAGVVGLLAVAGAAGTLLPTWRAMRVDPVATLRAE